MRLKKTNLEQNFFFIYQSTNILSQNSQSSFTILTKVNILSAF